MAKLKLHFKCYSGKVQISVQAVKPKPHTETFLKLDLEYKKRACKKKTRSSLKASLVIIHVHTKFFNFLMTHFLDPARAILKRTDSGM